MGKVITWHEDVREVECWECSELEKVVQRKKKI